MANTDPTLEKNSVTSAGDIEIQEVTIITVDGTELDIQLHVVELNLYEDIYKAGLHGSILIVDANNLSQNLGLTGDEYLRIKILTPSMTDATIYKIFKVYSITDRQMLNDTAKESFIMHFCSVELFLDAISPVYRTYKGKASDLVGEIFSRKLSAPRIGKGENTLLLIASDTANDLKFTSPGWSPTKCINWIASKSIGKGKSNNFLFYETNKKFVFANVEDIFQQYKDTASGDPDYQGYQEYHYAAQNLSRPPDKTTETYTKDVNWEYKKVIEMRVIETYNALKNNQNGHLANRLYTFDVITKARGVFDYDYVDAYKSIVHVDDIAGASRPPFPTNSVQGSKFSNPATYNQMYMQHSYLYDGINDNAGDRIAEILPAQTSARTALTNFKIEITVPGRTDIEAGVVVKFNYPDASPRDAADAAKERNDNLYSGYYLVTAIRHKITHLRHIMILELVKDSLRLERL
jgi:hypothetical protein